MKSASGWPTTPTATFLDPVAIPGDSFGESVAVSQEGTNTTVVIGEPYRGGSGSVHIYMSGASGWPTTPTATLLDPAATSGDDFGESVAVSGTAIMVGAPHTNSQRGAAYFYVKSASGWPTTPTTTPVPPTSGDFGESVAVAGGIAAIGAEPVLHAGSAYVYDEAASVWPTTPSATLSDPEGTDQHLFGADLSVSGKTIIVEAGGGDDNGAYMYVEFASGWPTTPTMTLAEPGGSCCTVAVSGKTALVGSEETAYVFSTKGPAIEVTNVQYPPSGTGNETISISGQGFTSGTRFWLGVNPEEDPLTYCGGPGQGGWCAIRAYADASGKFTAKITLANVFTGCPPDIRVDATDLTTNIGSNEVRSASPYCIR